MREVFVDTSGFYAAIDSTDPFHFTAKELFLRAEQERWILFTTNYVVHEAWSLIQRRLGWDAVDQFLTALLSGCRVIQVDLETFQLAAAKCRAERLRHLSLTDCVSFVVLAHRGIKEAIVEDQHFITAGITRPPL